MTFDDLDSETKSIINIFCEYTGMTKELAICGLIELGMLRLIVAIKSDTETLNKSNETMTRTFNEFPGIKKAAERYASVWEI